MFNILRPTFKDATYNILDFGAKSEANFNNRAAIQAAIDTCSKNGGGMVLVPNGYYLTGPIELKNDVNFHLADNAYILFTKTKEEYPLGIVEYEGIKRIRAKSPITANGASNIAITGKGVLDGNGELWRGIKKFKLTDKQWERFMKKSSFVYETGETKIWCPTETYYNGLLKGEPKGSEEEVLKLASENWDMYRPVFVSLVKCDKVLLDGPTFTNSPAWNLHPLYCTNFTLINSVVKNRFYAQNGDGIDLESCQNCEIGNTEFSVGDDGICLKSGKNAEARKTKIPTKNVWIHDCKVYDAHGGFVVGSEMSRGINNILVENCIFAGTDIGIRFKSAMGRGGVVSDIDIKNITMTDIIGEAIIFTMGYKLVNIEDENEGKVTANMEDVPEFKDIRIDNIICNNAKIALKCDGLKELPIHDITISNSYIKAEKDMNVVLSKNIKLVNTTIDANGTKYYDCETINA